MRIAEVLEVDAAKRRVRLHHLIDETQSGPKMKWDTPLEKRRMAHEYWDPKQSRSFTYKKWIRGPEDPCPTEMHAEKYDQDDLVVLVAGFDMHGKKIPGLTIAQIAKRQ